MKYSEACKRALAVQDAVNPRAVARLLVDLLDRACKEGTDRAKGDSPVYLVMDKLASLGLYPQAFNGPFREGYQNCLRGAAEEVLEEESDPLRVWERE